MTEIKTEPLGIIQKLAFIQTEIKAPKNKHNSFGNYDYRSAEDIQEALKPFEAKYEVATIISDTIETVGGRIYVKATVTMYDTRTGESISSTAYAREAETKKGMDDAQITGATSSYARKYALNGLLLLDDTKDVDTEEYQARSRQAATSRPAEQKAATSQQEAGPNRLALREYMHNHMTEAQKAELRLRFGLNPNSTEKDYEAALRFAQSMQ